MRYIEKGHEPAELTRQRTTPGAVYAAFEDLRIALAQEQGYICAFCMRRLDLDGHDEKGERLVVIAHLRSRHPPGGDATLREERRIMGMTYRNLVLTCNGKTGGDTVHCDKHQKNADITIPLFDRAAMAHVTFSNGGQVRLANYQDQVGRDDKHPGLLNLNAAALVSRRRQRWFTVADTLNKLGRWKEGELERQVQIWANKDSTGQLREDCECVVYLLRDKLRLLRSSKAPAGRTR